MKNRRIIILFILIIMASLLIGCEMKYRVFFNEKDGTVTYQDVIEGEKASYYVPTVEGLDFLGWYTEDDELFDFETPIKKNINLYAYYGMKEWTVTFVVDKDDESKNITKKVSNNHLVDSPVDPIKEGYIFLGWLMDGNEFDFLKTSITKDITINANFVKDEDYKPYLKITLNANNSTEATIIGVDRLSKISSLPTPVKEGYIFLGWFLGNEQITTDTVIKEVKDFTLYAHYEKIE